MSKGFIAVAIGWLALLSFTAAGFVSDLWFDPGPAMNDDLEATTAGLLQDPFHYSSPLKPVRVATKVNDCFTAGQDNAPCAWPWVTRLGSSFTEVKSNGTYFGGDNPPNEQWMEVDFQHGVVHYAHECCLDLSEVLFRAKTTSIWPWSFVHPSNLGDLRTRAGIRLGSARAEIEHVYGRSRPLYSHNGAAQLLDYVRADKVGCTRETTFVLRADAVVAIQMVGYC